MSSFNNQVGRVSTRTVHDNPTALPAIVRRNLIAGEYLYWLGRLAHVLPTYNRT